MASGRMASVLSKLLTFVITSFLVIHRVECQERRSLREA